MRPMVRCSANMPRSGGCICRSRRCRSWSSTRSWPPRTRISTSMAASISPAWRAPRVLYAQNYGSNRRPQGASTITQQVAKNFLLTNEVSFTRKIKEALLAMRIERTYSKDKILELYLNEIYPRPRRLRHRRGIAGLFRQVGQRTDHCGSRLSRRAAQGAVVAASGEEPRPRDRTTQLRHRPAAGKRLDQAGRRRQGPQGRR